MDDYNKASVSVTPVGEGASTQAFGTLANFATDLEGNVFSFVFGTECIFGKTQ